MKYLTFYYDDKKYKINLDKITMVQIKEGYIGITFDAHNISEISEVEILNKKSFFKIIITSFILAFIGAEIIYFLSSFFK